PGFGVGEEDGRAVGGEDAEEEAGGRGNQGVGLGSGSVGEGRGGLDNGGRVDLAEQDETIGGEAERCRCGRAIAADVVGAVAAGVGGVEGGEGAGGDAALAAGETMAEAGQGGEGGRENVGEGRGRSVGGRRW